MRAGGRCAGGQRVGGCAFAASCHALSLWLIAAAPPPLPAHARPACLPARLQRLPERILEKCVKGMLPKGRIASPLFQHLKVYKGSSHPHEAQRPLDITSRISKKPAEAL